MKKPHGSNCKCNSALEVEVQRLNARVKWIEIIILLFVRQFKKGLSPNEFIQSLKRQPLYFIQF